MEYATNVILIWQIMWVVFILFGISMLINKSYFIQMVGEFENNYFSLFISWLFTLLLWIAVICNVNTFKNLLPWVITVLWRIMFIKWAMIIVFPWLMMYLVKKFSPLVKYIWVSWILYIILWWYLLQAVNFMGLFK